MGWINNMAEKVKNGIRAWLDVQPARDVTFVINETLSQEANILKNRIWYNGDADELSQLYKQIDSEQSRRTFWAAVSTPGREIRKIHTGIPAIMVDALSNIIITDMNNISVPDARLDDWEQIERENDFKGLMETAVKEALYLGDGAFKISFDKAISGYPIIEWYPADRIKIIKTRGRLREVVFRSVYHGRGPYGTRGQEYILFETYGYGYITYELRERGSDRTVPLNTIPELALLKNAVFDNSICMAVPFRIYKNAKHPERGKSIFDGKTDDFDALDEAWSQWMQALRDGRSIRYIPENMIPRNPDTGEFMQQNAFDNTFIKLEADMTEGKVKEITVSQPAIPYDSYQTTYITALDLCLQGIISPSTIGIDVKKLDNAESQREKEKTTLYTRGKIIDAMQKTIPSVVNNVFKVLDLLRDKNAVLEDTIATIEFGEYANPSFESQVETIGKAKTQNIMSNEIVVEELYGDTKEEKWKQEEIERLNARDGIESMKEPALNTDGLDITDDMGAPGGRIS